MRSAFPFFFLCLFALSNCAHRDPELSRHVHNGDETESCQPYSNCESDWRKQKPIQISRRAFSGSKLTFESHAGYLTMKLPYEFIRPVLAEVQTRENLKLLTRGESHVTVITPPEEAVLKGEGVLPQLIDAQAQREKIQDSKLNSVCLGRGQAAVEGVIEKTYFIVLDADRLRQLRLQIAELIPKDQKSGVNRFEPGRYLPHLTVGFTRQDLFEQNGVVKDISSCIYPLELIPEI